MNRYRFITSAVLLTLAVSLILVSCRDGGTASGKGREVELRYATHLTMEEHDGYTVASIRNPWDTTKTLSTYLLLDEGAAPPEVAPGVQVVNVPLRNSVVYSTVHIGLLEDLGATDAVAGVCDTEYIFDPEMKRRLSSGRVADCGQSITPNIERIIGLGADAVLLSPFENSGGHGKIDQAGIPVIECADYMENSPLARAEWMRFYGRLYGNSAIADSLFAETERQYLSLKELASTSTTRPKVLMDRIYGQTWNLPAGHSTMGRMIEDAGGTNPFGEVEATGSLSSVPKRCSCRPAMPITGLYASHIQISPLPRLRRTKSSIPASRPTATAMCMAVIPQNRTYLKRLPSIRSGSSGALFPSFIRSLSSQISPGLISKR